MFEIKKTQILIEFLDGKKKVQLAAKKCFLVAKKVRLGFRGFLTVFLLLATPYVDILIGAQDFCWPKIINPLGQKPVEGWFLSCVGKTQILIEFLDCTKKVQLAAKKSFLVAKKSLTRV